jgi:hypothetical protein
MGIYAKLAVPEVWRLTEAPQLTFHVLGKDGKYSESSQSLAFPFVTPADMLRYLALRSPQLDDNSIVRQFREWVRQQQAGSSTPPPRSP